ncbi:MAG: zinc-dependent metalloprotease [bacterium]
MRIINILLISSLLIFTQCSSSKKSSKKAKGLAALKARGGRGKKAVTIKKKTKNCEKVEGLFTMYRDTLTGKAYMLIKKDQLDKEFIYFSYAENGLVLTGHFRGAYRDNQVFKIRKHYNNIEFVKQNTGFYFDENNAISKAAEANISQSILVSEKIVAKDTSKGEYLLDADRIFISEKLSKITPTPFPGPLAARQFKLGRLSKSKSRYDNVRNYPENTDIIVEYVYDNPMPRNRGGREVTDARSVSVKIQHSFIEVPENNFKPRFDDYRVGYFTHQVNDMTSEAPTPYRDVIHRWNLEKKDPDAALSEPVKPIVWWIENTTPVEYRETIKQAGLMWNEAFEKAGFKNAVEVKIQPDTAKWDAGDIRYNVLRWTSSPNPPFGGYGPSFVNPRTGEILGADIMLEYIFITNRLRQEKLFDVAGIKGYLSEMDEAHNEQVGHYCEAGHYLHQSTLFGLYGLQSQGASPKEREEFIKQALHYLILHEMGHTMGLNHNMKASQLHSPDQLADKARVAEMGLIGSVMDYPSTNFRLEGEKNTLYFTTKPGPYDNWAIEYGYSVSLEDEKAEKARLEKILERSTEPELIFGNDADDMRAPGKAIDPRVNVNDMSNDAISYSAERIALVNKIMANIKAKYSVKGQSYHELRNAYFILSSEILSAASAVSRYVGGVYVERSAVGQKGGKQPFTPVAYEDQKRAMKTLANNLFAPDALSAPKDLYNYLQMQRRGFGFFATTEDPKIHGRVLIIQNIVLIHLTHPNVTRRLTDSRLYGNKYSVTEMMGDLTDAIFKADLNGSVNTFRQNLQISYVERLARFLSARSRYDNISQSAALAQLKSILSKMKTAKNKGDSDTKAHRMHITYLIEKALETK